MKTLFFLVLIQQTFFQTSNITFCCDIISIETNDSLKSMRCLRVQLLLSDKTWSTRYNIPKIYRYSSSSTEWTSVHLSFSIEKHGIKLIYEETDTAYANMCFLKIMITLSVY